jgi:RsiW-degrading membrane proteinase PrsW (M82 family)
MEYLKYLSLAIPPVIAILIYFYLTYKFGRQPYPMLVRSFIWGVVSIGLVLLVQVLASYFELDKLGNIRRILFYSLVIMAFFSELAKFFFLKVFIYPRDDFKSPVDGIVYAVMISMGFATMNNVLSMINIPDLDVNLTNAFTSGPANVIFGVLMGFFIGMAKLRKIRFVDSMTGLGAAVLFHALYGFCLLTYDYKLLWAFFIGSGIIAVSLCIAAIRLNEEARREGQF